MILVIRRRLAPFFLALRAPRLDRELAGGCPPEASGLHSTRARQLVAAHHRAELAENWERLLSVAVSPDGGPSLRVPLRRERLWRAEFDIRRLIAALPAEGPMPVQGVAIATCLIMDGSGPLYNPMAAAVLEEVLRRAVELLDPALPLTWDFLDAAHDDGRRPFGEAHPSGEP